MGSICWHVFMLCLAMYAFNSWIVYIGRTQCNVSVSAMQSTFRQSATPGFHSSRMQTTPSTTSSRPSYQCKIITTSSIVKKSAKCSQPSMYVFWYTRSCQLSLLPHSGSMLPLSPGPPLLVDSFVDLWTRLRNGQGLTHTWRGILPIVPLLRKSSNVLKRLRRRKGSAWLSCH